MKNDDLVAPLMVILCLVCLVFGLIGGCATGHSDSDVAWKQKCIQNNIGFYDATNGNFHLKNLN